MSVNVDMVWSLINDTFLDSSGEFTATRPILWRENQMQLTIQLYEAYPDKPSMAAYTTFKLGLGLLGPTGAYVEVLNASIDSTNKATGLFVAQIDLNDAELVAALGTKTSLILYMELVGDDTTTLALMPVTVKNTVYDL